jgi:tetratricopeptide (TPR) repeat protein
MQEDEATLYNNLAGIAMTQGDDSLTRQYLNQAMAIYERIGNAPGRARTSQNYAEFLVGQQEYSAAEPYIETALEWCRENRDDAEVWLLKGDIDFALNRPLAAAQALARAKMLAPEEWTMDNEQLLTRCRRAAGSRQ